MGTFSLIVIYWPYLLLSGRPVVNFNKKLILFWLGRNSGAISQRYTAFKLQFRVCIEGISVFSPDVVFMMNRLEKGTITECGQYTEASENDFYQHWSSLKASRRSIEANEIIRFFSMKSKGMLFPGRIVEKWPSQIIKSSAGYQFMICFINQYFQHFFSIRFIQWLYSTEFGIFVLWHRTNHWRKIPFVDKLNIRLRYLRRCFLIKFFSCEQMQNSLDYISLKIKMENTWMLPTEE